MRSLQAVALSAGSFKGRQMLYMDSLRPPAPRAKDANSLARAIARTGLTWRDADECERITKDVLARLGPDILEPAVLGPSIGPQHGS